MEFAINFRLTSLTRYVTFRSVIEVETAFGNSFSAKNTIFLRLRLRSFGILIITSKVSLSRNKSIVNSSRLSYCDLRKFCRFVRAIDEVNLLPFVVVIVKLFSLNFNLSQKLSLNI